MTAILKRVQTLLVVILGATGFAGGVSEVNRVIRDLFLWIDWDGVKQLALLIACAFSFSALGQLPLVTGMTRMWAGTYISSHTPHYPILDDPAHGWLPVGAVWMGRL